MGGVTLDKSTIAKLLTDLSIPSTTGLTTIDEGYTAHVWSFQDGLLKRFLRISDKAEFETEALALRQVKELGVNVPEVIKVDDSRELFSFPFIILSEIKGTALSKVYENRNIKDVLFKAGRALAKINSVKTLLYAHCDDVSSLENGEITGFYKSLEEAIEKDLYPKLEKIFTRGKLTKEQITRIKEFLKKSISNYSEIDPRLNHGDFNPNHIFVESDQFEGIIDLGDKRSFDVTGDLALFSIYTPHLLDHLIDGWLTESNQIGSYLETDRSVLRKRINFFALYIAVNTWSWVIENNDNGQTEYLERIESVVT
jgi:aminoglycoside phosphotransferase (APT) family kinase protein